MPNNIEGRGLTDREMLQLCLELEKGRCRSVSNTLLETTHPKLREIYEHCFENASNNQFQLFEIMNKKGWYKTELATKEQIVNVQELMQNNLHPDNQF
ncbi:spore coat protein [Ureibacillus chungkukjangi]|uniref:Coat F domain-containing protein n=1 Tax=Ureibacillus chungkukjangi TaxID=1202712 RepID=A0A318TMT6_9BACL|nr:spore coat protein [Ureibacillus chungkukjangi]PYF05187.1 coat F domain-containing protein [Ureibacillus chungkukjangi]